MSKSTLVSFLFTRGTPRWVALMLEKKYKYVNYSLYIITMLSIWNVQPSLHGGLSCRFLLSEPLPNARLYCLLYSAYQYVRYGEQNTRYDFYCFLFHTIDIFFVFPSNTDISSSDMYLNLMLFFNCITNFRIQKSSYSN